MDRLGIGIYEKIQEFILSKKFQNDFPNAYWESNTNSSGKILEISGENISPYLYQDVKINVWDDENLVRQVVDKNLDKLKKHYGTLIDLIFE